MTKSVAQIREMLDAQEARVKAKAQAKSDQARDNYRYRRMRDMPDMLEYARKKLAMLETEAISYDLDPTDGLPRRRKQA